MTSPPSRPTLALAPAEVLTERRADGSLVLRSPQALAEPPRHLVERLRYWSRVAATRVFLAERDPRMDAADAWRRVTYGQARAAVDHLAGALLGQSVGAVGPERPVLILSENGIDQALLSLAAMQVGVPVAPVSPAYSLVSTDLAKLRAIVRLTRPALVYASDGQRYARVLGALAAEGIFDDAALVLSEHTSAGGAGVPVARFADLLDAEPSDAGSSRAVEEVYAALGPESVAKVLFTSGSTGEPKGVLNTQRMLCSNQQAIAQLWPFLTQRPPVVLDWLPWSHTFGGNHNFNMVLFHGATLYIDRGRPAPDLFAETVRNLREVSPTIYFNVPRGYEMLVDHLERDASLRDGFFRELDALFYAAAALSQPVWERLERVSMRASGRPEPVLMLSAWGSTETSPMVTTVHFRIDRAGVIGLPAPGTEVKLAPVEGKLELRVRGPNVTPGYWQRPDLTARAFDDEGFLCMGDAGRLADPEDPARGIVFDGRLAEDFKLSSGTWIHVGLLRGDVLAATAPYLQDLVLAGHDRDEVTALAFLNLAACRALCPDLPGDAGALVLARHPAVRAAVARGLAAHNAGNPGTSRRVARLRVLSEPPGIDAGEITDKGYLNQRAVLAHRRELVAGLYGEHFQEETIYP